MDPRPTNYLRQNIVFSYPEMIRVSFSLFLCLLVFCYFTLLLIFISIILFFLFLFMKIIFIFSCSGMFQDVPECSGMFRNVPCSGFYRRPRSYRKIFPAHYAYRNADLNLTLLWDRLTDSFFKWVNSLTESWGVRLTWLDCKSRYLWQCHQCEFGHHKENFASESTCRSEVRLLMLIVILWSSLLALTQEILWVMFSSALFLQYISLVSIVWNVTVSSILEICHRKTWCASGILEVEFQWEAKVALGVLPFFFSMCRANPPVWSLLIIHHHITPLIKELAHTY